MTWLTRFLRAVAAGLEVFQQAFRQGRPIATPGVVTLWPTSRAPSPDEALSQLMEHGRAAPESASAPLNQTAIAKRLADDILLRRVLHAALYRYSQPEQPGQA